MGKISDGLYFTKILIIFNFWREKMAWSFIKNILIIKTHDQEYVFMWTFFFGLFFCIIMSLSDWVVASSIWRWWWWWLWWQGWWWRYWWWWWEGEGGYFVIHKISAEDNPMDGWILCICKNNPRSPNNIILTFAKIWVSNDITVRLSNNSQKGTVQIAKDILKYVRYTLVTKIYCCLTRSINGRKLVRHPSKFWIPCFYGNIFWETRNIEY